MTDEKRDELLLQIFQKVGEIETKLSADYRAIHGNGHPGLIERLDTVEDRVLKLEGLHEHQDKSKSTWVTWAGLLATAAGTVYSIIHKG